MFGNLGLTEKLGGSLLAQTVTDSFLFPTKLWASRDLSDVWKFVFSPGATNISFGDRLSSALFSLKIKSIDQTEINLGVSQFLQKKILTDGTQGYVLNGQMSSRLTQYFSDNDFANANLKFGIVDSTGVYGMATNVGQVLEVLGGKVVSVDKRPENDNLDCIVTGLNKDAVNEVESLFSCQKVSDKSSFDLEIRIGGAFAKRF